MSVCHRGCEKPHSIAHVTCDKSVNKPNIAEDARCKVCIKKNNPFLLPIEASTDSLQTILLSHARPTRYTREMQYQPLLTDQKMQAIIKHTKSNGTMCSSHESRLHVQPQAGLILSLCGWKRSSQASVTP